MSYDFLTLCSGWRMERVVDGSEADPFYSMNGTCQISDKGLPNTEMDVHNKLGMDRWEWNVGGSVFSRSETTLLVSHRNLLLRSNYGNSVQEISCGCRSAEFVWFYQSQYSVLGAAGARRVCAEWRKTQNLM